MDVACLRHTELPHTSKLFSDFQYHFDRVNKYYAHWPGDPDSYRTAAAQIQFPDDRRAALVAALRARNGDSPSLELLARPGTVAVVTGQQVGLFSGPAYTIFKALTAVRLAEQLNRQGQPAVPVFWLATEDHDLAEIDHTFVFGQPHRPEKLQSTGKGETQQPVGSIALDQIPLDGLRAALGTLPFGGEIADLVAQSYTPGATFGSAFHHLLRALLGKWNLLFVDPLDPALRQIAAPLLRQALERAPELKARLIERGKELEADGYHAQVLVEPQSSLFFLLEGKRRVTLRRNNGSYASKERHFSPAEMAAHAEQLSPNALLRPVMQDFMLPTVAYVGGPAELAYFAQTQVLYQELLGRMPVVLARSSFTLLNARARKLMTRYDLGLPCFFHGEDCLREKVSKKLIPPELSADFQSVQTVTEAALDKLGANLRTFDPTLASALAKSRAKILYQLSKLDRKAAREALRRDQRSTEESQYLSGLIFPNKHLQERYYSILPFLAEHGLGLLDTLYDAVNLDCPDHKILAI